MVDSPHALLTWLGGALLLGIIVVVFVVVRLRRPPARGDRSRNYSRSTIAAICRSSGSAKRVREVADRRFIGGADILFGSRQPFRLPRFAGERLAPRAHTPKDESTWLEISGRRRKTSLG